MDFFHNGIWRMDWGLGNPNNTAALIAILMVAVWLLAFAWRRGFWVSLILFTLLGGCLVHTFSRGGLVAVLVGLAPLLYIAPRPWPRKRIVAIVISIWAMIGFSIYLKANERFVQGIVKEDRSITHRLAMWKYAPSMIVDAPAGWGAGKAADAYMQWYQPVDDLKDYRTFVNSHLEWLIEIGWPGRVLYILGWLSSFVICWPSRQTRWLAVPLGTVAVFFVAATFSSVSESIVVWIVPVAGVIAASVYRLLKRDWPAPKYWAIPLGGTIAACLALYITGAGSSPVRGSADCVIVGKGEPSIWLVVDRGPMGKKYGKTLRGYLAEQNKALTVGLANSLAFVPNEGKGTTVAIAGEVPEAECALLGRVAASADRVVLLTPKRYPQELSLDQSKIGDVEAIFGEFSQSPYAIAWEGVGKIRRIAGAGDFLPSWPDLVFQERL